MEDKFEFVEGRAAVPGRQLQGIIDAFQQKTRSRTPNTSNSPETDLGDDRETSWQGGLFSSPKKKLQARWEQVSPSFKEKLQKYSPRALRDLLSDKETASTSVGTSKEDVAAMEDCSQMLAERQSKYKRIAAFYLEDNDRESTSLSHSYLSSSSHIDNEYLPDQSVDNKKLIHSEIIEKTGGGCNNKEKENSEEIWVGNNLPKEYSDKLPVEVDYLEEELEDVEEVLTTEFAQQYLLDEAAENVLISGDTAAEKVVNIEERRDNFQEELKFGININKDANNTLKTNPMELSQTHNPPDFGKDVTNCNTHEALTKTDECSTSIIIPTIDVKANLKVAEVEANESNNGFGRKGQLKKYFDLVGEKLPEKNKNLNETVKSKIIKEKIVADMEPDRREINLNKEIIIIEEIPVKKKKMADRKEASALVAGEQTICEGDSSLCKNSVPLKNSKDLLQLANSTKQISKATESFVMEEKNCIKIEEGGSDITITKNVVINEEEASKEIAKVHIEPLVDMSAQVADKDSTNTTGDGDTILLNNCSSSKNGNDDLSDRLNNTEVQKNDEESLDRTIFSVEVEEHFLKESSNANEVEVKIENSGTKIVEELNDIPINRLNAEAHIFNVCIDIEKETEPTLPVDNHLPELNFKTAQTDINLSEIAEGIKDDIPTVSLTSEDCRVRFVLEPEFGELDLNLTENAAKNLGGQFVDGELDELAGTPHIVVPAPDPVLMRKSPVTVQEWVDHLPIKAKPIEEKIEEPLEIPSMRLRCDAASRLSREASVQSSSSLDSLLDARRPDPVEVLLNLGFGGSPGIDLENCRIPKRFLVPSQCKGGDWNEFLRRELLQIQNFECASLGFRGLCGPSHQRPSAIVANIMEKLREQSSPRPAPRTRFTTVARRVLSETSVLNKLNSPQPSISSSVLTPDNRKFLDSQGKKSPEVPRRRIIFGQKSFAYDKNGELVEVEASPSVKDSVTSGGSSIQADNSDSEMEHTPSAQDLLRLRRSSWHRQKKIEHDSDEENNGSVNRSMEEMSIPEIREPTSRHFLPTPSLELVPEDHDDVRGELVAEIETLSRMIRNAPKEELAAILEPIWRVTQENLVIEDGVRAPVLDNFEEAGGRTRSHQDPSQESNQSG